MIKFVDIQTREVILSTTSSAPQLNELVSVEIDDINNTYTVTGITHHYTEDTKTTTVAVKWLYETKN